MHLEQILDVKVVEILRVNTRARYELVLGLFDRYLIRHCSCLRAKPCLALLDFSHQLKHIKAAALGEPVLVLHRFKLLLKLHVFLVAWGSKVARRFLYCLDFKLQLVVLSFEDFVLLPYIAVGVLFSQLPQLSIYFHYFSV